MKIPVKTVKSIVYPVRFTPAVFERIKKVAKKNDTTPSKVIHYFVEEALKKGT